MTYQTTNLFQIGKDRELLKRGFQKVFQAKPIRRIDQVLLPTDIREQDPELLALDTESRGLLISYCQGPGCDKMQATTELEGLPWFRASFQGILGIHPEYLHKNGVPTYCCSGCEDNHREAKIPQVAQTNAYQQLGQLEQKTI